LEKLNRKNNVKLKSNKNNLPNLDLINKSIADTNLSHNKSIKIKNVDSEIKNGNNESFKYDSFRYHISLPQIKNNTILQNSNTERL